MRRTWYLLVLAVVAPAMAVAQGGSAGGATGGATGAASGASATPAPQIITVPAATAPTTPSNTNGPDWSRSSTALNGLRTADADQNRRQVALTPDQPTEFQLLVQQTIGVALPIFGSNLFNGPPDTFAPVNNVQVTPDYVIGPGDEIRLSATGQFNQQGTFVVDRAGTISIPEVGTVTVAGLRFADLRPFLRQQLGRVYRNFELNVTLGQLRSIQVYILGEARQPGAYTVSSLTTLVDALFVSGGVRPQGSLRNIELRRGARTVSTVDLYSLLLRGDKSKDVPLQPGDVIFVPAAGPQVAITGSVTNPGIYELRGETSLSQLVQLANGLTSTANAARARIESVTQYAQRGVEDVNLDASGSRPLRAGDIITVGSISDEFRDAVTLRGNVANPGRFAWHTGMRISDLIPDRKALITRNYFRARNALGQAAINPQEQQQEGRVAVSSAPNNSAQPASTAVRQTTQTTQTTQNSSSVSVTSTPTTTRPESTTVGDALTQNNGTFPQQNEVVLSAPDVDLAYAVIERLDPTTLTTSLLPFNLGAVLSGDPSQNLTLQPGDVVTVFSKADIRVPQAQQTRFVRLEGEFVAAGVYSVKPGETLRQLIARAGGFTPDAYLFASEFTRQSTRRIEEQRLREYADSLDAQITSEANRQIAGAIDPGNAAQAAGVSADNARAAVQRLRAVQPTGRIVLKLSPTAAGLGGVPDLPLEDGDRFIVPRQPSTINVAGEVYNASAFLYADRLQVRNYVRDAGGPTRDADPDRVFVIRADGSVVSRQYSNVSKAPSLPGDTVVVPPKLIRGNVLRNVIAITGVLSSLAFPLSLIALLR